MTSAYIIKSILTLIVISAALYLALFSIKKIKRFPDSTFIKVKGMKALQHATLYVLEIDSEEYLIGTNQNQIQLLNKKKTRKVT